MVLEDKDILQVDATVIAGALVFLTISTVVGSRAELVTRLGAVALAVGVILLFGLSAVQVASGHKESGMGTMNFAFKYLVSMMLIQMGLVFWSLVKEVQFNITTLFG